MTDKRTRAVQKRAKTKAKEAKKTITSKLVNVQKNDSVESFLDIFCPPDALALTDELYDRLTADPNFPPLTKSDFNTFREKGYLYNPTRQSFISQPVFD
jgi:hypothetical protein